MTLIDRILLKFTKKLNFICQSFLIVLWNMKSEMCCSSFHSHECFCYLLLLDAGSFYQLLLILHQNLSLTAFHFCRVVEMKRSLDLQQKRLSFLGLLRYPLKKIKNASEYIKVHFELFLITNVCVAVGDEV